MQASYAHMKKYTIVLTPHALNAMESRFADVISRKDIIKKIDKVRHRMRPNQVSGTCIIIAGIKVAHLYMRRIFNEDRGREEIEAISLTSSEFFHTYGQNENGEGHMDTVMI